MTDLIEAVQTSTSFEKAALKLGVSRPTLTKLVRDNEIDISHFRPGRGRFYDPAIVLKKDSTATRTCVKKTVLRLKLLEERCPCGLTNEWNGQPLTLELDHIDGDPTNNEISNLRFLCPNCHSQTETNKGKNKRGWRKTDG